MVQGLVCRVRGTLLRSAYGGGWSGAARRSVAVLRSAPGQGVSRPPHAASRDCRNGSPLARANPCAPAPECGVTREKEKAGKRRNEKRNGTRISVSDPTRSAASRAVMAGWAGEGGGRFGERREYEAPTLPRTPRQHGMARHHTCQARNSTLQQHSTTRHHTRQPGNSNAHQKTGKQPQKSAERPPATPTKNYRAAS